MAKKVVSLGEILMRLTPPNYERFLQAKSFDINYGGAEANVALELASLGLDSYFVTQLPNNDIGKSAENYLRSYGVKTDYINFEGDKLGAYFFEKGLSLRPSKVIYDRKHSAICDVNIDNFDFDKIFEGADWFHISGITPVLSKECAELTKLAMKKAKEKKLKISLDLNYRSQLATIEDYEEIMEELLPNVDLCIGWLSSIEGCSGEHKIADFATEKFDENKFLNIFSKMSKKYNIKYVVTTLRENFSASKNAISAIIYEGNKIYKSHRYEFDILDRVGSGDAFAAGLIYGLINDENIEKSLNIAVASAVLKHTINGDCNITNINEITSIIDGKTSGSVQR